MTVGQRIAQKRKELGLSQEGLGARLGVSRQAIYKWESDAALPEIEKLVNLSREFSVSIDWLLGQEDESREPRELTAEQLRMVEEIVGRYLAARPGTEPSGGDEPSKDEGPERPKKRRRWPLVLAGLAAVVLIGVFSNLFSRLDRLYNDTQNLQMNVGEIRYDVNSQIYGITQRVEDILQRQNALTAEQSAEVSDTDYRTNTVTVSARAVPRTFVEGMTAEFILVSGGETVTVPGELGDDHAFTAQITGPLSDNIAVSAVLLTGDQRQTQLLNQFDGLYSSSFPELTVNGRLWASIPRCAAMPTSLWARMPPPGSPASGWACSGIKSCWPGTNRPSRRPTARVTGNFSAWTGSGSWSRSTYTAWRRWSPMNMDGSGCIRISR